jgi:hypothetical protein
MIPSRLPRLDGPRLACAALLAAALASPAAAQDPAPAPDASVAPGATAPKPFEPAGPVAAPAPSPAPVPALALAPAPAPAATRPPETYWYRPTKADDADSERSWNSSILGGFDPWTKQKVTILAQLQTLEIQGKEVSVKLKDPAGSGDELDVTFGPLKLTHPQTGVRVEWGNWSLAYASGNATFSSREMSGTTGFTEIMISRAIGATVLYDFGIPDVRIGISWPELYLRGGWSDEAKDPAPGIKSASLVSAGIGVSWIGFRVTAGDLLFGEVRVGHFGYHAIARQMTIGGVGPNGSDQDVFAVQPGMTNDWLPTFRIGIAL